MVGVRSLALAPAQVGTNGLVGRHCISVKQDVGVALTQVATTCVHGEPRPEFFIAGHVADEPTRAALPVVAAERR
jgi:hypothetical protein